MVPEVKWCADAISRIVEGASMKKAGKRIKEAVLHGIEYARRYDMVYCFGEFLWNAEKKTVQG